MIPITNMWCGLRLIVVPGPVPESLRFGRNSLVLTPTEKRDLMLNDETVTKRFLDGHGQFLMSL